MMNAFSRKKSRFPQRDLQAKRRRTSARNYRGEQLESRAMLAGDLLNAFHNADMPADVSGDGHVTISDALLLVSELRNTGPRQLGLPLARHGGGEGEGGGMFLDVNGDTMLTLGDALDVVSELRSEGEGLAIDDFPVVNENTSNNQLNVLANDQSDVGDTLTINQILLNVNGVLVTEAATDTVVVSESGGEFRIAADRQSIFYTPRPGFFGEESLAYELNDGNAGLTTASVTVGVNPVNPAVRYRLEASSSVGGPALSEVDLGDEFVLNVYVQDIRSDLNDATIQGLEQGFLDVAYDMGLVTLLDDSVSELTFGSNFTEFQLAEFQPGQIDEVGASRDFFTDPPPPPLGNGQVLLFAATFTADNSGTAVFSGNHPEDGFSQTLVTNPAGGTNIFTPGQTPPEDFFVLEFVGASLVINPAGFAMSDTATVVEDSGANTIPVLANDTTPPGGTLALTTVSTPANGTAVINDNGTPGDTTDDVVIYTPNMNFAGVDTFSYTASDGLGGTDMASVTVTVTDQNDPPTAVNDMFSVSFNAPQQSLNVLANDSTAPDSATLETLTITSVNGTATSGTVSVAPGGGSVLYTPPAGPFVTDTFQYTISDGRDGTATATATITGVPFDDVVAIRLEASETDIDEGDVFTLSVFIQDLRNDPTIDLGVLTAFIDLMYNTSIVTPVAGSDGNILDFTGEYEPLDPEPIFTPGEIRNIGGFFPELVSAMGIPNGGDEFLFFTIDFMATGNGTANFSTSETADQTFFPIELVDDTGSETPVPPEDIDFGTTEIMVNPPVFDTDVVVSVQAVDPLTGVPVSVLGVGETFEIRVSVRDTRAMTPDPAFEPAVAQAYIDLLIAELGDAVTLVPNSFMSGPNYGQFPLPGTPIPGVGIDDVGDTIDFGVVISDPTFDGNQPQLVFSLDFTTTGVGEVVFQTATSNNPDNPIELLDPPGEVPLNEITFLSTTVFIADENAPTAVSDQFTTFQGNSLTIGPPGVLANDSDPNGNPITAALQSGPNNGTVTLNANGSFTYTPNPGFVGNDTFTYRAVDSTGLESNTAIVRISVTPVSPLDADPDVYTTPLNTTLNVNAVTGVLANDVGMGLTASLASDVSNGTLTFNADGSFTYVPNTNFTGIDSFTYSVTDASGSQQTARVSIGVGITPGSLGGRVYVDSNVNGIYEPDLGELPIGNAEVIVIGSSGVGNFFETTVTTDASGQYSLPALLPGIYTVIDPFPEFMLSGTYTVNGVVTVNTAAGLESFVATDAISGGDSAVVNFGHMGIHPEFLSFRDISARTPKTGAIIANDVDGNNLWYILLEGFEDTSNPDLELAIDGLTAELTLLVGSGQQSVTLDTTGTSRFRVMGVRPGEGSIIRIEGTLDEAIAGEAEADLLALDALMAEGFE